LNNSKETTEKRDKIINSALEEFSRNGYRKTAVDDIVQKAGVSKGLVFHYFGNKKNLFLSLYKNCTDIMITEINQKLDLSDTDLFNRLSKINQIKMGIMKQHPYLYKFLVACLLETDPEIKTAINRLNSTTLENSPADTLVNIDCSKFKEGVDLQLAIKLIMWVSEGLSNEIAAKGKFDLDEMLETSNKIMALLKSSLYERGIS